MSKHREKREHQPVVFVNGHRYAQNSLVIRTGLGGWSILISGGTAIGGFKTADAALLVKQHCEHAADGHRFILEDETLFNETTGPDENKPARGSAVADIKPGDRIVIDQGNVTIERKDGGQ